jgi:thymidylate synthase (FAD)
MPEPANIKPQSKDNKQGREGVIDPTSTEGVQWLMNAAYDHSYDVYKTLLGQRPINEFGNQEIIYDPYDGLLTNEFPGIAREIARSVMPLGSYSEFYWKCNIWNLMHFLHLRLDPHAQLEIRVFAEAMYKLVQPLFPNAIEAFDDYVRGAYALSRMERELLKALLQETTPSRLVSNGIEMFGGMGGFAMEWGMSKREMEEFLKEFEIMPKPTSIT